MGSPKLRKTAASIFGLLILIFIGYQFFRSTSYSAVKTETAVYGTTWQSKEVSAAVVRKETPVYSETSGIISYELKDGAHVSNGGIIANVFASAEDVQKYSTLGTLKSQIEKLETLNSLAGTFTLTPEVYTGKIESKLTEIERAFSENNTELALQKKEELLYLINQKNIVTGDTDNYNDEINALNSQYDTLYASFPGSTGKIYADKAGTFISETDGYENSIDYSTVLNMDASALDFSTLVRTDESGAIGKICSEFKWYAVFKASAEDAIEYKNLCDSGRTIYLSVPFKNVEKLPAKVAKVNQADINSEAAVIIECSYMDENIAKLRFEQMQVELYSYSGVLVGQNAIHFEDVTETVQNEDGTQTQVLHENVQGVYIIDGASLKFVQIIPLAEINGYVVCKTELSDGDIIYTDDTVKLYDEIVTEGKDLYDGKIIQ